MIYLQKGVPPAKITEKVIEITKSDEWNKADENNSELLREFFDLLEKQVIREELVREQHGLCAYCMKRIEANDRMNIEHYIPIKGHKDKALDYKNMLGCCKGGGGDNVYGQRVLCCDASKKDQIITIDPRNKHMMERIRYSKSGRIYVDPEDSEIQHDIDQVLMLNGLLDRDGRLKRDTTTQLVMGRRSAYKKYECYMKLLGKKYNGNESKILAVIKKKIDELEALEVYPEFVGVTLYFLRRRLHGA